MGITGKGRCNLTNTAPMTEFIARTPGHGKFLFSAYRAFSNEDLLRCVHQWGLATKEERGGRVFPQSDSAIEVRKLLYLCLLKQHVELHLCEEVLDLSRLDTGFIVRTDRETIRQMPVSLRREGFPIPLPVPAVTDSALPESWAIRLLR